jgi:hypothetical protein
MLLTTLRFHAIASLLAQRNSKKKEAAILPSLNGGNDGC